MNDFINPNPPPKLSDGPNLPLKPSESLGFTLLTNADNKNFKYGLIGVVAIIILIVIPPITFVPKNYNAYLSFLGQPNAVWLESGWHFKYPLYRRHLVPLTTQHREYTIVLESTDLQLITWDVGVNYSLREEQAEALVLGTLTDYESTWLLPRLKALISQTSGRLTINQALQKQADLSAALTADLGNLVYEHGIQVEQVDILSIKPSDPLQASYESQALAELEAEVLEIKLRSEADALASELSRIKTLAPILKNNPDYINYELMKKWEGSGNYCPETFYQTSNLR